MRSRGPNSLASSNHPSDHLSTDRSGLFRLFGKVRTVAGCVVAAFLMIVLFSQSAAGVAAPADQNTELIVKTRDGVSPAKLEALTRSGAITVKSKSSDSRYKLLRVESPSQLAVLKEELESDERVIYVEPNHTARALFNPNDTYYRRGWQWNFAQVNASKAWDTSMKAGRGTIVAILDTGLAYENYGIYHQIPDFASTNFVPGYDFVNSDSHANDDNGHGSHVGGVVAQSTNNGYGTAGLAFNAKLMPVKVLDEFGIGNAFDIAQGIRWAADNGAEVINLSLATSGRSQTVEDAVNYARKRKNVTIVAASGNNGVDRLSYPAGYASVISVGATTKKKVLADYSQYGKGLDIVAPGGDSQAGILQESIVMDPVDPTRHGFYWMWGTSVAAPHVSAAAAMLISKGVTGPSDILQVLTQTAQDLGPTGYDNKYGHGLLDVLAALRYRPISTTWYFAQGRTANKFNTRILILNPSGKYAKIRATFSKPNGLTVVKRYNIRGHRRLSIHINSITPLRSTSVSTKIESINGVGVVAERSTKFAYHGKAGAHSTIGAPSVSRSWHFAYGNAKSNFETIFFVYNPSGRTATFRAVFTGKNGSRVTRLYSVGASSRKRIAAKNIKALRGREFSTKIESLNGIGLVAERATYFKFKGREGGHSTIGATSPSKRWLFAAGATEGGLSTQIFIHNPEGGKTSVRAEFFTGNGRKTTRRFTIGNRRQLSIMVDGLKGLKDSKDLSIKLQTSRAVVAERVAYFRDARANGGYAGIGAKKASANWYIAGGQTGGRDDLWIYILNPGSKLAKVTAQFMKPNGTVVTRKFLVPGQSRKNVSVGAIKGLRNTAVSTVLTAADNVPVVVGRVGRFYNGTGGGEGSIGYSR